MSKTLLLADDSVTIQKVVGITFASEDVVLVTVDNGDDALTRAREIRPDLVLADVSMPGLDGYELCHAIKTDGMLARTPVVLLTGTFEVQDESRAAQVGADAQIAKPFEAQALVDLVRRLIGSGGSTHNAPVQPPVAPTPVPAPPVAAAPPVIDETPALATAPADPEPLLEAEPILEPERALPAAPERSMPVQAPELPVIDDAPVPQVPAAPPAPTRDLSAPAPAEPESPAQDTDFSFSDLEFAKSATTGAAPDATQVMAGVSPLSSDPASTETARREAPPLDASPLGVDFGDDEPLSLDPLDPEPPQAPTTPHDLSPAPAAESMTAPRFQPSSDDSMRADADGIPDIDMNEPVEVPPAGEAGDALAFDKTRLMDPNAASEMLDGGDFEAIPEEPIGSADSGPQWQPASPTALAPDATGVDAPSAGDSQPIPAAAISTETLDAPAEVMPLGEHTMGGSEIFGDPLGTTGQSMGTTVDEQTEPDVERPAVPAAARGLDARDAEAMRDSIEKLAWDAFGPMSEQLVHEVVKKIEEIAWDVVPQLAEKIVQQEIRRLTQPDD